MSDKFRITLDDGTDLYFPKENAQAAMQALDRKGIKFADASDKPAVEGNVSVGEPEAIKSQHGASDSWDSPPPAAAEPKPWYQSLAETGHDAYLGATHGATMGLADDIVPKAMGNEMRANDAAASQRSPYAYAAGDAVGGFAPAVAMGAAGLAGRAGSVVSEMGAQGLQGMLQGGARSFGNSDPEEAASQRAMQALSDAGKAGGEAAAFTGAIGGIGRGLEATSSALGSASDRARTAALGATGANLGQLAESRGLDVRGGAVGRMAEDLGVTNKFFPVSPAGYADRLGARADQADQQITQSLRDAQAQGVTGPGFIDKPGMLEQMAQRQKAAATDQFGDSGAQAAAIGNVAQGMGRQPLNSLEQLRSMKSGYDDRAYQGAVAGSSESLMGQAHKAGADVARGQLRDAMGYALPETESAFTQGNQDYGTAATLQELAAKRANQQYAGGGLAGNLGAGAVGAGVGFGIGGVPGMMGGASLGMARPALAAAQQYGPDFGANLARLGEQATGAPGAATSWIAQQAPTGAMAAQRMSQPQPTQQQPQASDAGSPADNARGYLAPQVIGTMLQQGQMPPQYAQQFAGAKDQQEIAAIYERLTRTDPQFARTIAPQIQMQTTGRQ